MKLFFTLLVLSLTSFQLTAQSIADKKAMMHKSTNDLDSETSLLLKEINQEIEENQSLLKELYQQAEELYKNKSSENYFKELAKKIHQTRITIQEIQTEWKAHLSKKRKADYYSLWDQPEITLDQLIMDYSSPEYAYLIPPEIASMKLSIHSNLPIPRESWGEMLNLILESNGIGIKTLNPYLRKLFVLNNDQSAISSITNQRKDLSFLPKDSRICYVLSPNALDPLEALQLIKRFTNSEITTFHMLGRELLIISRVDTIQELLKIYDFMESHQKGKEYRVFTLKKTDAFEMEEILMSIFQKESNNEMFSGSSLKTIALKNHNKSLFLMGSKEEVSRAEEIIHNLEEQMASAKEKSVFWYSCKHSSAEELAKTLEKIYPLMRGQTNALAKQLDKQTDESSSNSYLYSLEEYQNKDGENNFIVDAKTGSLLMVVERHLIQEIKDLLKRLDIPKKMVRIEVLLVEKKVKNSNHLGLNLLKMGAGSSETRNTGLSWNDPTNGRSGILSFFLSRQKTDTGIPAYDLAYRFLLSHEDVQVNASPSVTTVNQTPAKIEIVEEISINTGVVVERDGNNNGILKDSFSRSEYGIIIEVTPNVHLKDEENALDNLDYITLNTDIRFDSSSPSSNSRPDITKRHIKNEVRIADGQTVIIGGLRRKDRGDKKERVPFLGELPGIGKLFGNTDMNDSKTEMFVFLTPKIISNPSEDFKNIQLEELKKRPGDLPEFMYLLEESKNFERRKLMAESFSMLFGRPEKKPLPTGEYDGR